MIARGLRIRSADWADAERSAAMAAWWVAAAAALFRKNHTVATTRQLERYWTVLDRGGSHENVYVVSRWDQLPLKPRRVLLRRGFRGRPAPVVADASFAQNPGALLDGEDVVLYGGTDDVDNPNPNIHRHAGRGVVATRLRKGGNGSMAVVAGRTPVLSGRHPGCVEARTSWHGVRRGAA